jgi:acetyltransferase-like isoleucine patch superfamily enzyme
MVDDQPTEDVFLGNSPITVGRYTYGLEKLTIHQWGEGAALKIGSFCSIASSVTIYLGGNHRVDWVSTYPFGHVFAEELGLPAVEGHPSTNGDVVIGNDVWIGKGATIMSGVTIGNGAVISANSHVIKDVAPYEIVGGNPAKSVKRRFDDEVIDLLEQLAWWDQPLPRIKQLFPLLVSQPETHQLKEVLRKLATIGNS